MSEIIIIKRADNGDCNVVAQIPGNTKMITPEPVLWDRKTKTNVKNFTAAEGARKVIEEATEAMESELIGSNCEAAHEYADVIVAAVTQINRLGYLDKLPAIIEQVNIKNMNRGALQEH